MAEFYSATVRLFDRFCGPVLLRDSQATTILVYKVFSDGFVGQDLGSSAAQSVILLVIVGALTIVQFRYIERRVHY